MEENALVRLSENISVSCQGEPVRVGQWFCARYGFTVVTGRCVDILPQGLMLAFRWGGPFRERNFVEYDRILGRANDPRWFKVFG